MHSKATFTFLPSAFESAGSFITTHKILPKIAEDMFNDISQQEEDITLGLLANAYNEVKDLKEFWEIFGHHGVDIYGDSGGLQAINLGHDITPKLKEGVYNTQARYSTMAMSFDEIPLLVLDRGDSVMGIQKVYVDSWFKKKAQESGRNIVEQIKVFKKHKAKGTLNAKILFIIQGKSFEYAREWAWFMFEEIRKEPDYEEYIGGLALGNTGPCGPRNIADFILRFQKELEFLPEVWRKQLHILGAGSPSKLIGFLLASDEWFLEGTNITADATTQTRAIVFGNFMYYDHQKQSLVSLSVGRDWQERSQKAVEEMWKVSEPYLKKYAKEYNLEVTNFTEFRNTFTEYAEDGLRLKKDFPETPEGDLLYKYRSRVTRFLWTMTLIKHFFWYVESIRNRARKYRAGTSEEKKEVLRSLKESLPRSLYKSAQHILGINNHQEYVKGLEIIPGHPYHEILEIDPKDIPENEVVTINGKQYITDIYNNEVRGRVIKSESPGCDNPDTSTKRGLFLNSMNGITIDTWPTEVDQSDQMEVW